MAPSPRISGLSDIAENYDAILCDVWGVLHNGMTPNMGAVEALKQFSDNHGPVVMITNSPRPSPPVIRQIAGIGVPDGTFDEIVTSGDATRALIEAVDGPVFHLGPDRDHTLYEGMDVAFADWKDAKAVVCTGLVDDTTETPEDYAGTLRKFKEADLPFICANPDIVVHVGDQLRWCAGALARDYLALGGETRIVGKPHAPIYDLALERVEQVSGKAVARDRVLCIGDGMPTDIKGAEDQGLDVLYVSAGIHADEYGPHDDPDANALNAFLEAEGRSPVAWLPRLVW